MLNLALARARREQMGLTLAQLGGLLGVDASTIHNWENGRHEPRGLAKIQAWAGVLGIPVDELISDQEVPA